MKTQVEAIAALASAITDVAAAITLPGASNAPAENATGDGYVGTLTEAVMSVASGLCRIASAIDDHTEVIGAALGEGGSLLQAADDLHEALNDIRLAIKEHR